jgi:hypothetical protein
MAFTRSARPAQGRRQYFGVVQLVCAKSPWLRCASLALVFMLALIFATGAEAQNPQLPDQGPMQQTSETPGKTSGNYNTQQNIEFGYRDSLIHGNLSNYDTFLNYGSGWRLFD